MQLFYTPDINGNEYILDETESKHCLKVLRLNIGSIIHLTDGKGNLFKAEIENSNLKACKLNIIETISSFEKRNYYLHMAVAPTKNIDRFEWFVEKATEIGIDEISPIFSTHSERRQINTERLERIVISAMKQSIKAYKTKINQAVSFNDFLVKIKSSDNCYIAHCRDSKKAFLSEIYKSKSEATILIGPEGDFSEAEIEQATNAGFQSISLGESRLRTETAALMTCAEISFLNR